MSDRPALDVPALHRALLRPAGAWERVDVVATSPSTSSELVDRVLRHGSAAGADGPGAAAGAPYPAPSALVAEHQVAGRGRAGRSWQTPPRAALTVSALLRPRVPAAALGWLPLAAGLAVVRTVREAGLPAAVKWPNDVLVPAATDVEGLGPWRKVAGVLAEVVPTPARPAPNRPAEDARPADARAADAGLAVVVGVGLNVTQTADELPVPSATSLALAGRAAGAVVATDRTALLTALLRALTDAVAGLEATGGDAAAVGSGGPGTTLADAWAAASATLGTAVRAELAGSGEAVEGTAVRLDAGGGLVLATADGERTVTAGDVHHLRRA